MKKVFVLVIGLMLLAGISYGAETSLLTLDITVLEAVSLQLDVASLSAVVPLGASGMVAGIMPDNPAGGQNPAVTITNSGIGVWKLTSQMSSDAPWNFKPNWSVENPDDMTFSMACSVPGETSAVEPTAMLKDTLYTSPWNVASPLEGVSVGPGDVLRLYIAIKSSFISTVVGTPGTINVTLGALL